jgi:hypothetical protein
MDDTAKILVVDETKMPGALSKARRFDERATT